MIDKIKDIFDDLPDIVKAILLISAVSIFWDIVVGFKI
jgi:hypothetical protein|tara:strand:+ start:686 stop:799 length:114 start_codon:yes stop_codon:yes gene_type:complete